MKAAWRALLVAALVIASATGLGLVILGLTDSPRPTTLAGDTLFPDFSANGPRHDTGSGVRIALTATTLQPWVQGRLQEVDVVIHTDPGPDVTEILLTTLVLYVERPATQNRDIAAGDLVLLEPAGADTWVSQDGPFLVGPHPEFLGTNFFVTFSLSLDVAYADGSSYGYGGWPTAVRLVPIRIAVDTIATGGLIASFAVTGLVLFVLASRLAPRPMGMQGPRS